MICAIRYLPCIHYRKATATPRMAVKVVVKKQMGTGYGKTSGIKLG